MLGKLQKSTAGTAVILMGKMPMLLFIHALCQILLTDGNVYVRRYAAEVLVKIGDQRVLEPLIQALQNDESRDVRSTVAYALDDFGDSGAIGPLTQAKQNKLIDDDVFNKAINKIKSVEAKRAAASQAATQASKTIPE
ncbi:MAG: HEAT repeat domain-containing protein [Planctomycetes bacterium]|nr:HEAT repeat domain-containing protein [Planctomycetota bacterium]